MKLPNRDRAFIDETKLRGYLLSRQHTLGRFKAAFFASLGYTEENWTQLDEDIRSQHLRLDVEKETATPYGRKFTITGPVTGPTGRTANVVSVWIIRDGEDSPKLVTAYPGAD